MAKKKTTPTDPTDDLVQDLVKAGLHPAEAASLADDIAGEGEDDLVIIGKSGKPARRKLTPIIPIPAA